MICKDWSSSNGMRPSESAMHNSVNDRHMLSTFRRTCRSVAMPRSALFIAADTPDVFGLPVLPTYCANDNVSAATASSALTMSGGKTVFDLLSAECKSGCVVADEGDSFECSEASFCSLCRGEDEIVVTVVVPVRGLSPEEPEKPDIPFDGGNFPVNSSRFILDFKSSNSSQTVDAADVETTDPESCPLMTVLSIAALSPSIILPIDLSPLTTALPGYPFGAILDELR